MRRWTSYLGLAALAVSTPVFAQASRPEAIYAAGDAARLRVERIGSEHGLAHNAVQAILEDRDGFLWFGTEDGLQRYDGVEFETFRSDSGPVALSHSRVEALLETADGALWVGTAGGLDVLSADRTSIRRVADEASTARYAVSSLALDPDGRVTAGTAGHGLWAVAGTGDEPTLESLLPGQGEIQDHRWLPDGGLLLIRRLDGYRFRQRFDPALKQLVETSLEQPLGLAVGVSVAHDPLAMGSFSIGERLVNRVCWEDEGRFAWVGAFDGLFLQPPEGGETIAVTIEGPGVATEGLAHEILALHRDRAGTLWLGTYGGLLKADPARRAFDIWPRRSATALEATSSFATALKRPDRLIVGTFGGGLLEVSLADGSLIRRISPHLLSNGRCSDYIWSVAQNGRVLVVASNEGTCVFDASFALLRVWNEWGYRHVVPAADGSFWLSGVFGAAKMSPTGALESRFEIPGEALLRISDDELWVAVAPQASAPTEPTVVRLNPSTGERESHAIARRLSIFDLVETNGRLLAGTTDGLLSFDPAATSSRIVVPANAVGTVYSIQAGDSLPAGAEEWWLGTSRGIARVDLAREEPLIAFYDADDGLGNVEFNRRARVRLQSGRILLGGMSGITVFDPSAIKDNAYSPPIRLKEISIEGPEGLRRVNTRDVTMGPSDYAVAFRFAALNFTRADRNRYRYRLVGVDGNWVEAGTTRSARYAGLNPGDYRFEVVGSNNDGVWSTEPAAVTLRVRPAFHATWWFRLAAALLLAAVLAGFYRVRVSRLLELERVRLRIARDLHDEFGSELSGIALASEIIGKDQALSDENRARIGDVERTSRRVMEGLREVVWYVNPEHDRFDSLVDRMRSTARRLSGELPVGFQIEGIDGATGLDMRARRHLYLAFKELLTNAVKHSQAQRVRLRLALNDGIVELAVEDDGVGVGPSAGDGTGLSSVRARAEAAGGSFNLESAPGDGTRAVLRVPVTGMRHGRRSPE